MQRPRAATRADPCTADDQSLYAYEVKFQLFHKAPQSVVLTIFGSHHHQGSSSDSGLVVRIVLPTSKKWQLQSACNSSTAYVER